MTEQPRKRFQLEPLRHVAVPVSLLAVLVMNLLSVVLPLGGRSMEQISAMSAHQLQAAPWTFGIWSLVYAGLIAFAVYQLLPSMASDRVGQRLAILFVAAAVLNVAWLIAWHFLWSGTSLVIMVLLAVTVLLAYLIAVGKRKSATLARRLMVILPWRLYLGWIVVALAMNIMAVLSRQGWPATGVTEGTALTLLGLLLAWGLLILIWQKDLIHTLVLAWGLIGIMVGQWGNGLVPWVALGSAVILLGLPVLRYVRQRTAASNN